MRPTALEFDVEDVLFRSFRTGDSVTVDGLEIEPVHVDHSIPGADRFIIHTSNGAVVYTRDFRVHGTKSEISLISLKRQKK